ncbi:MAG: condensation domain-containing protein, partial [Acidobacteriota bacterium]|nr:condensation domain-containing protein [Acidobacteriota bacterium]
MQEQVIEGYRLSPHQKHLWLLQQDGTPYRSVCVVTLAGPLDPARLHSAIGEVVKRHEILRTSFHGMAGMKTPVQVINDENRFGWKRVDLSGVAAEK